MAFQLPYGLRGTGVPNLFTDYKTGPSYVYKEEFVRKSGTDAWPLRKERMKFTNEPTLESIERLVKDSEMVLLLMRQGRWR